MIDTFRFSFHIRPLERLSSVQEDPEIQEACQRVGSTPDYFNTASSYMTLSADELIAKARDQLQRGRLQEAHVTAHLASQMDADDPNAWWILGRCCVRLEDPKGAARAFKRVADLAPDYPDGWASYGIALIECGEAQAALEPLRNALKLGTDNAHALYLLAGLCEEQKDSAGESDALSRLDELGEVDSSYLLIRLGNHHFKNRRYHEALRCYRKAVPKREGSACLYNMGLVYN